MYNRFSKITRIVKLRDKTPLKLESLDSKVDNINFLFSHLTTHFRAAKFTEGGMYIPIIKCGYREKESIVLKRYVNMYYHLKSKYATI
jgi:hypothetical protein